MNLSTLLDHLRRQDTNDLAHYLTRQRWFRSKAHRITSVDLLDIVPLSEHPPAFLAFVHCQYDGRSGGNPSKIESETYVLPLRWPDEANLSGVWLNQAVQAFDAGKDREIPLRLTEGIREGCVWHGVAGSIRCRSTSLVTSRLASLPCDAKAAGAEQSNTSYFLDHRLILKLIRKLEPGISLEVEMLEFLTAQKDFEQAPKLVGHLVYQGHGHDSTVAILQDFVPNQGDGWSYTLEGLRGLLRDMAAETVAAAAGQTRRRVVYEAAADFLEVLGRLGAVTGALHLTLASDPQSEAFRPERIGTVDVAGWQREAEARIRMVFELICRQSTQYRLTTEACSRLEQACLQQMTALSLLTQAPVMKIRVHGDYHLGQVLRVGRDAGDFVVVDFEGEPARSLEKRRDKACVLKDLAGMLRSFQYAAEAVAGESSACSMEQRVLLAAWEKAAGEAFLRQYTQSVGGRGSELGLLPPMPLFAPLLAAFQIDKAVYELEYELQNRPAWAGIPLRALQTLTGEHSHDRKGD